ncbi:MAG: hypothetical protein QXD86_02130 [Candidatus Bathyarchaeia archaeon]
MLGLYTNFPQHIHRVLRFKALISTKKLQRTMVNTLHDLNTKRQLLSYSADVIMHFEFGIADGEDFNYLDAEEVEKILKALNGGEVRVLDFFCVICYYRVEGLSRKPLKFDYYMLRMIFDKGELEIRVYHEKGPRRVAPEELAEFIINKVNEKSSRRILKTI